ncbi:polysaccharide biosynthesis protein [Georgenia thermotolerans]|uniref:Polysaccharide biosynthesis protein n=1 Tax=Georgenia thermotolerans TaxID=527326 RepID=A0A7J5URX2_9MICO|nr:polysaccharide biosynthesis protein [Georgenia thermotolerans]KAE8764563.1 polysaccharide biosynthesis protein [Georgenia thermotolerans]
MRAVAVATVFAALSGYAILVMAARSLGAADYDVFAVFWAAFFALGGVVNGLMHETTRAVSNLRRPLPPGQGALPVAAGALVAALVASVVVAGAPVWAPRIIPDHTSLGTALLATGIASFTLQGVLCGALSGVARWRWYAVVLAVDAGLRLAAAGAAVLLDRAETGLMVATVVGTATWLLMVALVPSARQALRLRVPLPLTGLLRRAAQAMVAASATAVLVVGFPVLLQVTARDAAPPVVGGLVLAVTLTRAPLLVPLTSFQNAIVVHFVRRQSMGARALLGPVLGVLAVAALGAGAAWLVGPRILALMGEGFDVPGPTLAALTAGAGTTAALVVSGSAALAFERHSGYMIGWWVATGVAVTVLLLPAPLTGRAIAALLVGPLVGLVWHAAVIARAGQDRSYAPAPASRDSQPD